MKSLLAIFALCLTVACTAPDASDDAALAFDAEHLATSPACFADDRASLLEADQTLLERGPSGMVRISGVIDGHPENFEFSIAHMSGTARQTLDAAAADFFQAAGQVYNVATDTVIYHRATDGTFCAVTRDAAIGDSLLTAAQSLSSID